jgi:hypothetical protein
MIIRFNCSTRPHTPSGHQPDLTGYYDTVDKVRRFRLFRWLLVYIRTLFGEDGKKTKTKVRSWRVRDAFVAFLARYMALDPFERIWAARSPSVDDDDDTDSSGGHGSPSYSTLAYPSNRAVNADANARLCSTFPVSTTNNP